MSLSTLSDLVLSGSSMALLGAKQLKALDKLLLKSMWVSKYAVGLGVLAAVADSCIQGTMLLLELRLCPPKEEEQEGHWNTARTFRGFVYGGTAGLIISVSRMIFFDQFPIFVILPQVIPCELLLFPFQYVIYKQQERHLTRNIAYYMLVYTLLNLMVYIPVYLFSTFWDSAILSVASFSVQQMWLGFCAVSLLIFFNRYWQYQKRIPLPTKHSKALEWSNRWLILAAQFFGNLSVVFLTTDVILSNSLEFPFGPTLPLWFAQILVNSQFQMAGDQDVDVMINVLRIMSTVLSVPACSLQIADYLPSLETLANVLAFSAFSLWIGTFNQEWKELFNELEGEDPDEPDWQLDHLLDNPTLCGYNLSNLFSGNDAVQDSVAGSSEVDITEEAAPWPEESPTTASKEKAENGSLTYDIAESSNQTPILQPPPPPPPPTLQEELAKDAIEQETQHTEEVGTTQDREDPTLLNHEMAVVQEDTKQMTAQDTDSSPPSAVSADPQD